MSDIRGSGISWNRKKSDTTILASTGAECKHIRHVETQLPYATLVAIICAVGYLIAGLTLSPWLPIAVEAVLLIVAVLVLGRSGYKFFKRSCDIMMSSHQK